MNARGFTLLEVLVALAVLAISAAAVLRQTQLGVQQQQMLELKSTAMWVADDELAALLARPQWPDTGSNEHKVTVRGQEWTIRSDVQTTPDPNLRKIVVDVALADQPEGSALVSFTTYRGQY